MRPLVLCLSLLAMTLPAVAQQAAPPPSAEISADLGNCSAALTVTGADQKPVYAARVTARVQYGAFGVKKLDLEAYTGADGKVRITHLPNTLKHSMTIHVSKGDIEESVDFDPVANCHPTYNVQLH